MNVYQEILLVLLFVLIGGVFNACEIALISLRQSQVDRLAATRGRNGRRLERLLADPNTYLAAVQIAMTVATLLASAFGAATIADRLTAALVDLGVGPRAAEPISVVTLTLVIAFVTLIVGELVPIRIGLQRSEGTALFAARPVSFLAVLLRPVIWLAGVCTNGLVRLLGGDPKAAGAVVTQEELRSLVSAHESLSAVERRMMLDVFDAEQTLVREVMVPRPEVDFLDATLSLSRAGRTAAAARRSRFPVIGHDQDDVVGVVHIRDLLAPTHPLGRAATVGDVASPVTVIPGTTNVLRALHDMRETGQHLAVVVDEYGGTDGIVTLEDLIEEIAGEMLPPAGRGAAGAAPTARGAAIEVDGRTNLDDLLEQAGVALPHGPYDTAAGFVMAVLGRVPVDGDVVVHGGHRLTVVSMEGRRVARLAVAPAGHGGSTGADGDRAGTVTSTRRPVRGSSA